MRPIKNTVELKPKSLSLLRRMRMWRHWNDFWMGLLYACCVLSAAAIVWAGIWGFAYRTEVIGYQIVEHHTGSGKIRYYEVVRERRHASDQEVFTTTDINEAIRILERVRNQ